MIAPVSTVLSVGVVGAGAIARGMHLPVLTAAAGVQVVWLTDSDASRGAALARAFGLRFVPLPEQPRDLPPCDVALLAIPLQPRNAYYEQFAARGTAVFAEKPFARNAADHERFMAPYPAARIGCSYMRRGSANHRFARRAVTEGWFGRLRALRIAEGARSTRTGVDDSYQDLGIEAGGGILVNLGCHSLDLACFVTGATRYAVDDTQVIYDGDTDRKAQARLRLLDGPAAGDTGIAIDYTVSWLDRQDNTVTYEFEGATLVTSVAPARTLDLLDRDGRRAGTIEAPAGAVTASQAYYLVWRAFLDGVLADTPGIMAAAESLPAARLIDELRTRGRRA